VGARAGSAATALLVIRDINDRIGEKGGKKGKEEKVWIMPLVRKSAYLPWVTYVYWGLSDGWCLTVWQL